MTLWNAIQINKMILKEENLGPYKFHVKYPSYYQQEKKDFKVDVYHYTLANGLHISVPRQDKKVWFPPGENGRCVGAVKNVSHDLNGTEINKDPNVVLSYLTYRTNDLLQTFLISEYKYRTKNATVELDTINESEMSLFEVINNIKWKSNEPYGIVTVNLLTSRPSALELYIETYDDETIVIEYVGELMLGDYPLRTGRWKDSKSLKIDSETLRKLGLSWELPEKITLDELQSIVESVITDMTQIKEMKPPFKYIPNTLKTED